MPAAPLSTLVPLLPRGSNGTASPDHVWEYFEGDIRVVLGCAKLLMSLLGVVCNLVNLYVFTALSRRHHTPNLRFYQALSSADLTVSLQVLAAALQVLALPPGARPAQLCQVTAFLVTLGVCCSTAMMATLSVDRFVAVCYPLHYYRLVTPRLTLHVTLTLHLYYLSLLATITILGTRFSYDPTSLCCVYHFSWNRRHLPVGHHLLSASTFCIPSLVIVICYIRIAVVARRIHAQHRRAVSCDRRESPLLVERLRELRGVRTVVIIVGAYYCLCLPWFVWSFLQANVGWRSGAASFSTAFLLTGNSVVNSIVYITTNKLYRGQWRNLLRRKLYNTSCYRLSRTVVEKTRDIFTVYTS